MRADFKAFCSLTNISGTFGTTWINLNQFNANDECFLASGVRRIFLKFFVILLHCTLI